MCLALLVGHMRARGFSLLDAQFTNPHLERFGCEEVDPEEYQSRLAAAVDQPVTWGEFDAVTAADALLSAE